MLWVHVLILEKSPGLHFYWSIYNLLTNQSHDRKTTLILNTGIYKRECEQICVQKLLPTEMSEIIKRNACVFIEYTYNYSGIWA